MTTTPAAFAAAAPLAGSHARGASGVPLIGQTIAATPVAPAASR
jgi:hypothetical protein